MPPMNSKPTDLDRLLGGEKESSLKSSDVCRILEKCLATGVSEISFQGLSAKFGNEPQNQEGVSPSQPMAKVARRIKLSPEEVIKEAERVAEKAEDDLLDEELALLDVEDPIAFEKLAEQGVLNNES